METKHHFKLSVFLLLCLSFLNVDLVIAGGLAAPQQAIEDTSNKLQQKLQDKAFSQNFLQVTQYVDQLIEPQTDFDKISELVLGKIWNTANADEKTRFKQEFKTLLIRTYSRAFVEFKDWSLKFLPLEMDPGSNKAVVKTEVLQPGLQPVSVNYRMFQKNGAWKAYDIMIEGVSLVTNYRSTFNNEVKTKGSLAAVIDSLAKRNVEALSGKSS